jgi:hypothetical protein
VSIMTPTDRYQTNPDESRSLVLSETLIDQYQILILNA